MSDRIYITLNIECFNKEADNALYNTLKTMPYRLKTSKEAERGKSRYSTIYRDITITLSSDVDLNMHKYKKNNDQYVHLNILINDAVTRKFTEKAYSFSNIPVYNTNNSIERIIKYNNIDLFNTLVEYSNCYIITVNNVYSIDEVLSVYSDGSISNNTASYCVAVSESYKPCNFDYDYKFDSFTQLNTNYILYSEAVNNPNGTNNIGELNGLLTAMKAGFNSDKQLICISCDSKYSIESLREWIYNWMRNGFKKSDNTPVKNVELIKEIYAIMIDIVTSNRSVVFRWVKGHAKDEYNILCDEIAKKELGL